jgi:hypothetical protein
MKKSNFGLILTWVFLSGVVLTNCNGKKESPEAAITKQLSVTEQNSERKKWEASPDGIKFKEWEASPEGQKVLASAAKISNYIQDSSNMEAVVTSLTLPPGSRLGFAVMIRIQDDEYILSFGLEEAHEFEELKNLKVNDQIIIRSHFVSYAPKYAYPIINGSYVERDHKILYKRIPRKDGC